MAKKIKKFSSNVDTQRRGSEKLRRAGRSFTRAIVCYMLLVIVAVFCGMDGRYDLSNPSLNGFAVCFLLLPAYLPMLIVGTLATLAGIPVAEIVCGREVIVLGACDLLLALIVWLVIRLIAVRKQSSALLKNSRIFVLIMVYWGVFQLACCFVQLMWESSGLNVLHNFAAGH